MTIVALTLLLAPLSPSLPGQTGARAADLALGLLAAGGALLAHRALARRPSRIVLGAFAGAMLGGLAGLLARRLAEPLVPTAAAVLAAFLLVGVGAATGASLGSRVRAGALRDLWQEDSPGVGPKIIDTSVIIDGRIHDVAAAGFLEGRLLVPQFVLGELQQVADSSDGLKRARGRKGLELLEEMKGLPGITVEVTALDFPEIREVDHKLIEAARRLGGAIVTNDYNLNKVARVRDIPVLNINELANALKPVVLPGEAMRVFLLKEGKEPNQGVAYLDDGTMVVVDDGRARLGQTVDIVVTSVLQTTAGKMFFGRVDAAAMAGDAPGVMG